VVLADAASVEPATNAMPHSVAIQERGMNCFMRSTPGYQFRWSVGDVETPPQGDRCNRAGYSRRET
jgi:hypothetical protein